MSLRTHPRDKVLVKIEDVAAYLEEMFGRKLVAFMCNLKDPKAVGRWAKGERTPRLESESRLRTIYLVLWALNAESPDVARAWFIGMNPDLDDATPAECIRDKRFRDVMGAARSYASGAWS